MNYQETLIYIYIYIIIIIKYNQSLFSYNIFYKIIIKIC